MHSAVALLSNRCVAHMTFECGPDHRRVCLNPKLFALITVVAFSFDKYS